MSIPNTSEKSTDLNRQENLTKGNISAKKVVLYTYNSGQDILEPYTGSSTSSANYESRNDTLTDTNLVYLGKALPGSATSDAAWQIKRYDKSAGHMSFADDETTFTKVWDSRASYSY